MQRSSRLVSPFPEQTTHKNTDLQNEMGAVSETNHTIQYIGEGGLYVQE